jgi:tyrosyl-tRNA synthetase
VMYRKLLGLPEPLLEDYLRLTTDLHPDEVDALMAAWKRREVTASDVTERLAREVVALYYGAEIAGKVASASAIS